MKFEVEVYMENGKQKGCEIVEVESRNRAEAEIRAKQVIQNLYDGKIVGVISKLQKKKEA